jgi:hypothetical protein
MCIGALTGALGSAASKPTFSAAVGVYRPFGDALRLNRQFQGRWMNCSVGLSDDVLRKIYFGNAEGFMGPG